MNSLALAVLILAAPEGTTAATAESNAIDVPLAGWRAAPSERTGFLQPVNYPSSSVGTEDADGAALIKGRVAASTKSPAMLIVNGTPLPMRTEEDGSFARPWSFGPGSNSVELRAEGAAPVRRQFYEAGPGKTPVRLRVLLAWDSDGTDVDLHVVGPTGEHTFYGDRVSATGGALDVDVTTGYGPEIYAHPNPPAGIYHVYVNYYGAGERPDDELTIAQVTVLFGEGTMKEKRQHFSVPLRAPGDLTLVHSFVYP